MAQTLLRTPLHDRHVALGARMVPFAGWEMPVQYAGVIPEHKAVRADAGVFDVSHMGEFEVEGPRATELLQATLSNDLEKIQPGQAQYTLLTNDRGGIIDDLIAYRLDEFRYLLIVNAANREVDFAWLKEREIPGSDVRDVSDAYGLLAVQGPRALERLGLPEARQFTFAEGELDGIECMVNRTGYTGEAGCELLVWPRTPRRCGTACSSAAPCHAGSARCPVGSAPRHAAARASLPLHGNDITQDTDAISAGLGWCCELDKEFSGAQELRELKARGPERKLVSFVMEEKAVPRQGMPVEGGGEVTSGTHSPMLDRGIGMGYVPVASASSRHRVGDRRPRQVAPRACRQETDLQARGVTPVGRERELSRRPEVPQGARLGPHRR